MMYAPSTPLRGVPYVEDSDDSASESTRGSFHVVSDGDFGDGGELREEYGDMRGVPPEYGDLGEPNGVLKTIPRGPELMHKLMGEVIVDKQEREAKEAAKAESMRKVPSIVIAASLCNTEALREMIGKGVDMNEPAPKAQGGWLPLHSACMAYRRVPVPLVLESVDILLDAGARVDSRLPNGSTALHVACEAGATEVMHTHAHIRARTHACAHTFAHAYITFNILRRRRRWNCCDPTD